MVGSGSRDALRSPAPQPGGPGAIAKTRLRGRRPMPCGWRQSCWSSHKRRVSGVRATPPRAPVGCLEPEGCRGRPLSPAARASSAAWSSWRRSALLASYWRSRPLCSRWCRAAQGLLAEVDLDAGIDGELQVFGHLPAIAAVALDQGPDGAGSLAEHQVAFCQCPGTAPGSCWMPSGCRGRAGRVSLASPDIWLPTAASTTPPAGGCRAGGGSPTPSPERSDQEQARARRCNAASSPRRVPHAPPRLRR